MSKAVPFLLLALLVLAGGCGGSSAPKGGKLATPPALHTSTCTAPKALTCESYVKSQLAKLPSKAQTTYNYCNVELWSGTATLKVKSAVLNNDHDDWTPYPAPAWDQGPAVVYGSTSGFARGCSNTVTFTDGQGTVEIYVSDPYRGDNTYTCKTTGNYTCAGPLNDGPYDKSSLAGDSLRVLYLACTRGHDYCWAPFTCANGRNYPCS